MLLWELKHKSCLAKEEAGQPADPPLAGLGWLGLLLQLLLPQLRILKELTFFLLNIFIAFRIVIHKSKQGRTMHTAPPC